MHTIRYSSSRQEVWRWYWRSWAKPDGLWLYHLIISVSCAVAYTVINISDGFSFTDFIKFAILSFLACLVLFPLWSQIMFKPALRTLSISVNGLETSIGKQSGKRSWAQIKEIESIGSEIVIKGTNNNAFIIPMRAFNDEAERQEFLHSAQTWNMNSACLTNSSSGRAKGAHR
ncbi:MAG: YcxB family protein [gamma proteobacterium symbiont of Bathyaustriella thionipta]|nr:YcxB family protein [gamma proteobacterium symbiont of Bathyaustriella thionipta]